MEADDLDIVTFMELLKSDELLLSDLFGDEAGGEEASPLPPAAAPTPTPLTPAWTPLMPFDTEVVAAPFLHPHLFSQPAQPATQQARRRVKPSGGKRKLKFTVKEEVHARLHGVRSKKSCLIDKLVRACYTKFGEQWVSWSDIKEVARDVGFSPSSHVFRSVWPLVTCRYQLQPDGSVKVQETHAINFPYWLIDRTGPCTSSYKLRLAPEFFE